MSQAHPPQKVTPAPWCWHISDAGIDLRTPHSGQLLVMDFARQSPRGKGVLRFARRTDRMGGLMVPAHKLVTAGHTRPGFVSIDNPDARVIQAAPELLAACKEAVSLVEFFHGTPGWEEYQNSPEMKRIHAAIARAEGGGA